MTAAVRGYKMILIMPDNLSVERRASMTAYGAELILTPASQGGMEYARDLATSMQAEGKGKVLDQFANGDNPRAHIRSEEHTSELQSLMRISYAVFCLKKKKDHQTHHIIQTNRN